jgi:hypothetical protein
MEMTIELEIKMDCYWQRIYTATYNDLRANGRSPKIARIQASRQADYSLAQWVQHEMNNQH